MALEPIETIKLLGSMFIEIASRVEKVQGASNPKAAKDVLTIFQTLNMVEAHVSAIITGLATFAREPTTGMKVHYIHTTGKNIEKFEKTLSAFLIWLAHQPKWFSILAMFQPDPQYSKSHKFLCNYYHAQFSDLRCLLEAINSPNPKRFPEPQEVDKTLNAMEELLRSAQDTKQKIRAYARDNFTVEDFFE